MWKTLGKRTTYKVLFGKQKDLRVSLELGIDVMITSKYILKRQDGRTWNRYVWLEDMEIRLAVVNTVINLRFIQNSDNFLTRGEPVTCPGKFLLH
jgi:hypothetical protein